MATTFFDPLTRERPLLNRQNTISAAHDGSHREFHEPNERTYVCTHVCINFTRCTCSPRSGYFSSFFSRTRRNSRGDWTRTKVGLRLEFVSRTAVFAPRTEFMDASSSSSLPRGDRKSVRKNFNGYSNDDSALPRRDFRVACRPRCVSRHRVPRQRRSLVSRAQLCVPAV